MARRVDWLARAERALAKLLGARTARWEVYWQRQLNAAIRGGARAERRAEERAQAGAQMVPWQMSDDFQDVPDEWWEVEVAFDYIPVG